MEQLFSLTIWTSGRENPQVLASIIINNKIIGLDILCHINN